MIRPLVPAHPLHRYISKQQGFHSAAELEQRPEGIVPIARGC